jgi:hypothetical protein
MDVGIDQAGEQCGVAEVDDSGSLRMIHHCAGRANAVAFDQNFTGLDERAGVNLKKTGGVEHNRNRCRGRRLLRGGYAGKRESNHAGRRKRCLKQTTNTQRETRHG